MKAGAEDEDRFVVFPMVLFLFFHSLLCCFTSSAFPEETYRFERMWPTLQQPWYFVNPAGIVADDLGYVYVGSQATSQILKFTADGRFVTKWGKYGEGEGEMREINGLAVDRSGNVYVADRSNGRIQKFTTDGRFIKAWGKQSGGWFLEPYDIAVDSEGNVYATHYSAYDHQDRVYKFTSEGEFITSWGGYGQGDGEFDYPCGVAVDGEGNLYVADVRNSRIQKFTSGGQFIRAWGRPGEGEGEFQEPFHVAVDSAGYVYVTDNLNYRVQKFTSEGDLVAVIGYFGPGADNIYSPGGITTDNHGHIYVTDWYYGLVKKFAPDGQLATKWSSRGEAEGLFAGPSGIAVDIGGNVYVADSDNYRMQKFTSDGRFIRTMGYFGEGADNIYTPTGVAVDRDGYVYVVDWYDCIIKKFAPGGRLLAKWGGSGTGDGQFYEPEGIAVDGQGNIYVADGGNHRVQILGPDGAFIGKWGSYGEGDGEFNCPIGIAVDDHGIVYVADGYNHRVQKFTVDGQFVNKWGRWGSGRGQFKIPAGLAVDFEGNVYVSDNENDRIQKFSANGEFIAQWGSNGSDIGRLVRPTWLAVGASGDVFVTDSGNNRVVKLRESAIASNCKAIIVAGGGPYEGNRLWDATQMCANFAYRTLAYQGFTRQSLFYLTSDTDLDLDGNGKPDDVDGDATNANLERAITQWAAGAQDVVVYLTDHGGDGSFRMSDREMLSADALASWLNILESTITGKVTVLYDACQSGSFLQALSSSGGKGRIVVASASSGEDAYFVNQGSISFSSYFWTHIFNGLDVFHSFSLAATAIGQTTDYQHPLLDDNGNGVGNDATDGRLARRTFLGNGTDSFNAAPLIGSISPDQIISGTNRCSLFADGVTDPDGIARVWAVIRPPNFTPGFGDPVQSLPYVNLVHEEEDRYQGVYEGFTESGTYQIAVYAEDKIGNTSIPQLTTVSVDSPLSRKAILVAGGAQSDVLWPAVEKSVRTAHEALVYQGYSEENITFLSSVTIPGVDRLPTLGNLRDAIRIWGSESTQDLVLYLVGNGDLNTFDLNPTQSLSAADLDLWLDDLQEKMEGRVTVVYDGCRSGSFTPLLAPSQSRERVLIASASADEPACFVSDGDISFSGFFWNQVANGANVREAFLQAKDAVGYACRIQTPNLDDNGNGIPDERVDGELARRYTIGNGIVLAGDEPVIGSVSRKQVLKGRKYATLRAANVTTTDAVSKVWALIIPPGYRADSSSRAVTDLPTLELIPVATGGYEATYRPFSIPGIYNIAVYAMDTNGKMSLPKQTQVVQSVGPDLVVLYVSGPSAGKAGRAISISVGLKNRGTKPAGGFTLGCYLSRNTGIAPQEDQELKTLRVSSLDPRTEMEKTFRLRIPLSVKPGEYRLGTVCDIRNDVFETNEGNNVAVLSESFQVK